MFNLEGKKSIYLLNLILLLLPVSLLFSNVISEILIFSIIVIFFLNVKKEDLLKIVNNKIILFFIVLTLYLIINYLLNFDKNPSITRSLLFIRFPLYVIALSYFLNSGLINNKKIFNYWGIIILLTCLDLQFQSITGKNILGYEQFKMGGYARLGGFLNDELKIAYFINSFFVISVEAITYYGKKKNNQILIFIFTSIVLYSVLITGERANFICLVIFVTFFMIVANLKKYFLLMIVILATLIVVNYSDVTKKNLIDRMFFQNIKIIQNSLSINTEKEKNFLYKSDHYFSHYSTAWQIFKDYPKLGVGLKNFRVYCKDPIYDQKVHPNFRNKNCATHPHNLYFEILSELGIVGTIIFLSFFGYFFYLCIKCSYEQKNVFLFGNIIFLMTYFTPLLPRGSFFTNWNAMIFWTVFAISFHLLNKKKTHA